MNQSSINHIQFFVADHQLKREDGIVAFPAMVSFNQHRTTEIFSEVQIIHLPTALAVYILEFIPEDSLLPDMYSTDRYNFTYTRGHALIITSTINDHRFPVAIFPQKAFG